jgi:hypothetical protein
MDRWIDCEWDVDARRLLAHGLCVRVCVCVCVCVWLPKISLPPIPDYRYIGANLTLKLHGALQMGRRIHVIYVNIHRLYSSYG